MDKELAFWLAMVALGVIFAAGALRLLIKAYDKEINR
jgi:hypothetical protein